MSSGPRISQSAFEKAVADLDTDAFAAFVGRLWEGTAGSVTVDPPVVTVDSQRGRDRLLVTVDAPDGDYDPEEFDAVVTAVPEYDSDSTVDVVGPAELRERLLYGLSPETADDVCERFVGRPARTGSPGSDLGSPDGQTTADDVESDTVQPTAVASADDGVENPVRDGGIAAVRDRFGSLTSVGIVLFVAVVVVGGVAAAVVGSGLVGGENGSELGNTENGSGLDSGEDGSQDAAGAVTASTPAIVDRTSNNDEIQEGDSRAEAGTPTPASPGGGTTPTPAGEADFQSDRYATLEPNCNRSYLHVVQIQMNALRYNDNATNDGIRTVRRFSSPRNREAISSYDRFVRIVYSDTYAPMLAYDSVEYTPDRTSPTEAQVKVVTEKDGNITGRYTFHLTKQTGGEYEGCWMTDAVRTNTIAR